MVPTTPSREFQLIGSDSAVDLVNTLDWRFRDNGPEELLAGYDDLLAFCLQCGLLTAKQVRNIVRGASESTSAEVLVACRELREAAAGVLYAVVDDRTPAGSQIKALDRSFREARDRQRMVWRDSRLQWQWPAAESSPELPLWLLSSATERLLGSNDLNRLRACESPECRWLFLDSSKNHTRRWCDMKVCGNRVKARRYRERQ